MTTIQRLCGLSGSFIILLPQLFNRLGCRQHEQLDMAALGFLFHFVHDRQDTSSRADD